MILNLSIIKEIGIVIVITVCFSGCKEKNDIVLKTFEPPNQTSYVFNQPYQIIKDSLAFFFTFPAQHKDKNLNTIFFKMVNMGTDTLQKMETTFNLETSKNAPFGSGYFLKPNTENDVFLHTMGETWNSPVYYFGGEPMQCVETFALKFDSIDRFKTRISVQTLTSIIFKKKKGIAIHGQPADELAVTPTTIEEYCILRYIGSKFGESSMPSLQKPSLNL